MGLLLMVVGWNIDTWQFWCFLGLFWCVEQLGRITGQFQGIVDYLNMPEQDQKKIKQAIKRIREQIK